MAAIFFLLVLMNVCFQRIFAFNCDSVDYATIMNCDQCIKCGGHWCISPDLNVPHCSRLPFGDHGCSSYKEKDIFPYFEPKKVDNNTSVINPSYIEDSMTISEGKKSIQIKAPLNIDVTPIDFSGSAPVVKVEPSRTCSRSDPKKKCSQSLQISLNNEFCNNTGGPVQKFVLPLKFDNTIHSKMEINVPCACQCSQKVSVNDELCNRHGNLSCGVCTCMDQWTGDRCDRREPYDEREYVEPEDPGYGIDEEKNRGDIENCYHSMKPNDYCAGNGKCDDSGPHVSHCVCDKTKDGWQYFWGNYCEDLCMTVFSILQETSTSIYFLPYNETVTKIRDSKYRKIWVKCDKEETRINDCDYYARKNIKGQIAVMLIKEEHADAIAGGMNVTALVVPLVVVTALAMAGVGYYVWQGKGAPPTSKANYQGLDGPKTRVETNPVYIEPIKSYKNPTYGQQV